MKKVYYYAILLFSSINFIRFVRQKMDATSQCPNGSCQSPSKNLKLFFDFKTVSYNTDLGSSS